MIWVSSFKIDLGLEGGGNRYDSNINHPDCALRDRIGFGILGNIFETGKMMIFKCTAHLG